MSKKTKKLKKSNREKKSIKILKKPTSLVRFWFYKPKTEKTKPNQTKPKPEKNRAKMSQIKKSNQTETSWFELVSVFYIKNSI